MYDPLMSSKTVSVDLESENLLWLEARAIASGGQNLSEVLNAILAEARTGGRAMMRRSIRGTIPEVDPDLESGTLEIRELFRSSLDRTAQVLAETESKA